MDRILETLSRALKSKQRAADWLEQLCRDPMTTAKPSLLAADDSKLAELLAKARAGEAVQLEFAATVFRQKEGTFNRNFVRIKRGAMRAMAKSGAGAPFLMDHAWRSVDARGGTILESKVENSDDGEQVIHQVIQAVKPWAVEGVLDGTIDRFSIGWIGTGPVMCSVHDTEVFTECYCFPGDTTKEGDVVEWVFTSADLVEVSAVNVPAVVGTGIDEVRAAVMAANRPSISLGAKPRERATIMDLDKLRKLLGLPDSATEDEVMNAVATSQVRAKDLEARVLTIEADRLREKQTLLENQVEQDIQQLRQEGKLTSIELENSLRKMAALNYDTFKAYIAQMAPVVPTGRQTLDLAGNPNPAPAGVDLAADLEKNPHLPNVLRALGISQEQFQKYAPRDSEGRLALPNPRFDRSEYERVKI